jgi:CRP-like cAMP-binding protein
VRHTAETLKLLHQVALFEGVSLEALGLIAQRLTERSFAAGEVVFREGDPGDRLFLVLTGRMHIYVERQGATITYTRVQAGEGFGEMALIDEAPRSATVQAEEPSYCLTLDKQDFTALLAAHPQIALGIMKSLSQRLRHTSALLQDYAQQLARAPQPSHQS